jgi:RimJ/RimL family protein N-acetyltransferase
MAAFPPFTAPLIDGPVSLRPAAEWDIPDILIAYQDDPQLHLRLGRDRPPSGAELGARSERFAADWEAGTAVELTIVETGQNDCRGRVDAHRVDWEHRRAELGVWVAPAQRGQGVARRALLLASGWLFDECGLERLALLTETDNQAMLHAARGAGFVQEGVLRSYGIEQGRRIDLVVLSLIPADRR